MDTLDPNSPFHAWLQGELDRLGINEAELARRAGRVAGRTISQAAISQVRLRKNRLGLKLARLIAKALDVSEDIVLEKGGLKSETKFGQTDTARELLNIFSQLDEVDQKLLMAHARVIKTHRRRNDVESSGKQTDSRKRVRKADS